MPTPRRRILSVLSPFAALIAMAPALSAQGVNISMKAWRTPILMDTLRQEHEVNAPPAKVYELALKAFADLDIPTGRTDGKAGIIGSERFERSRSIIGAPMSRSFNCGESPTGPYADAMRLEIAVVVWVSPAVAGPGTKVGIATVASGRDISGTSLNPKACASSGNIETKLLARIRKLVEG